MSLVSNVWNQGYVSQLTMWREKNADSLPSSHPAVHMQVLCMQWQSTRIVLIRKNAISHHSRKKLPSIETGYPIKLVNKPILIVIAFVLVSLIFSKSGEWCITNYNDYNFKFVKRIPSSAFYLCTIHFHDPCRNILSKMMAPLCVDTTHTETKKIILKIHIIQETRGTG